MVGSSHPTASASPLTYLPTGTSCLLTSSVVNLSFVLRRFGRGEGVVSIVLKPLDAAIRDHDHVYATVRLHLNAAAQC